MVRRSLGLLPRASKPRTESSQVLTMGGDIIGRRQQIRHESRALVLNACPQSSNGFSSVYGVRRSMKRHLLGGGTRFRWLLKLQYHDEAEPLSGTVPPGPMRNADAVDSPKAVWRRITATSSGPPLHSNT